MAAYSGDGQLRVGAKAVHDVSYRLHIQQSLHIKDGIGRLEGDYSALVSAFEAGRATLVLKDGTLCPVMITSMSGPDDPAEFRLAGPPRNKAGAVVDLPST